MTIRPIHIFGSSVLHQKALEVKKFDADLENLVADMFETMDAAYGVGLAAVQIGVGLRVFVYGMENNDNQAARGVVVNPSLLVSKVSNAEPDPEEEREGCLSFPSASFPLKRANWVKVSGFDVTGKPIVFEATGWFARCMQHEYQHLEGLLYVDSLKDRYAKKAQKFAQEKGWKQGVKNFWLPGSDPDPFGHDNEVV